MLRIDVARRRTTVVYYDTQPSIGDVDRILRDLVFLRCLRYALGVRFAHDLYVLLIAEMTLSHWTSWRLKPQLTTGPNFLTHYKNSNEFL
jgi:hypothetical protein